MNISGYTKLFAVIGSPTAHSLSPIIQNTFAEQCGEDMAYLAFDVTRDSLADFFTGARTLNMGGFNVTMPLKEAVIPYMDVLDDSAGRYSSVNTVVFDSGRFYGYNTDAYGFLTALQSQGFDASCGHALILGTGGAARTAAAALKGCGMDVSMASRRHSQLPPFKNGIAYCAWDSISEHAGGSRILVNATPLGMVKNPDNFTDFSFLDCLPRGSAVYDIVYAPPETELLKQAGARGLKTLNGLSFLIHQAAGAFFRFTGKTPPDEIIKSLEQRLGSMT